MKIALLTQYYPPELGAPQARLSELVARFVKRGHQVYVLTALPNYPQGRIYDGYSGILSHELRDGASVVRTYIYPSQSVKLPRRLANYFSFVGSSLLFGSMVLPRVDYLLTESPPLFLGIAGYALSRLKHARWIFNVSDLWPESAVRLGVVGNGMSLRAATRLEAACYRNAWLVTGQSREIVADINRRFPDVPARLLSNGVDTQMFAPERASAEIRNSLAGPAHCVAIYAGLHGIAQGLDQVVQAAGQLNDTDLRIVLVGDGPEKAQLIEQARSNGTANISFLDPYPRAQMPSVLASTDIALVTLKQYLPGAVPSKLYEAMSAGLPVVLVAEGEAASIVQETGCGRVIAPGDVAGLAAALNELARRPDLRDSMGARGRAAAIKRFDRAAIADSFIDFLEGQLCSSATSSARAPTT